MQEVKAVLRCEHIGPLVIGPTIWKQRPILNNCPRQKKQKVGRASYICYYLIQTKGTKIIINSWQ